MSDLRTTFRVITGLGKNAGQTSLSLKLRVLILKHQYPQAAAGAQKSQKLEITKGLP